MYRKPVFRIILFCLLIVSIASFQAMAQSAGKNITLNVTLMANDGKSEAIIQSFNKVQDILGDKVQLNVVPDDQALNMVRTKIATGNADDIIVHPCGSSWSTGSSNAPQGWTMISSAFPVAIFVLTMLRA